MRHRCSHSGFTVSLHCSELRQNRMKRPLRILRKSERPLEIGLFAAWAVLNLSIYNQLGDGKAPLKRTALYLDRGKNKIKSVLAKTCHFVNPDLRREARDSWKENLLRLFWKRGFHSVERIDLLTDIELSSTFILSKKTKISDREN